MPVKCQQLEIETAAEEASEAAAVEGAAAATGKLKLLLILFFLLLPHPLFLILSLTPYPTAPAASLPSITYLISSL